MSKRIEETGPTLPQLLAELRRKGQRLEDAPVRVVRDAQKRGFPDMRSIILPPPLIRSSLKQPLLRDLLVTRIGYCRRAAGHYIPRPEGSLDHILHYCVAGCGWLRMAGQEWQVTRDTMSFLPGGEPHSYGASARQPWSIYWIHFTGRQAADYFDVLRVKAGNPLVHLPATPAILAAFAEIEKPMTEVHTQANLVVASTALARFLGMIQARRGALAVSERTEEEQVQATVAFMKAHLTRPVFLSELANVAHMSISRYEVAFVKRMGCPPITYFNRMRVQQACRLLDETERPVKVIAGELGFEDPYYFSRLFKKVTGIAPVAFRKHELPARRPGLPAT